MWPFRKAPPPAPRQVRDGRQLEPGTFPLADAGAFRNRVGLLRGAGNAINVAQAAGFVEAALSVFAGDVA